MEKKTCILRIHPIWGRFSIWAAVTALTIGVLLLTDASNSLYIALFISSMSMFLNGMSLSVYEDKLVQRIMGIPFRQIPWSEVTGVVHRPAHPGYRGRRNPPSILVVLKPGTIREFSDAVNRHPGRLPVYVVNMPVCDDQEDAAIAAFQNCWGDVTEYESVYFH